MNGIGIFGNAYRAKDLLVYCRGIFDDRVNDSYTQADEKDYRINETTATKTAIDRWN